MHGLAPAPSTKPRAALVEGGAAAAESRGAKPSRPKKPRPPNKAERKKMAAMSAQLAARALPGVMASPPEVPARFRGLAEGCALCGALLGREGGLTVSCPSCPVRYCCEEHRARARTCGHARTCGRHGLPTPHDVLTADAPRAMAILLEYGAAHLELAERALQRLWAHLEGKAHEQRLGPVAADEPSAERSGLAEAISEEEAANAAEPGAAEVSGVEAADTEVGIADEGEADEPGEAHATTAVVGNASAGDVEVAASIAGAVQTAAEAALQMPARVEVAAATGIILGPGPAAVAGADGSEGPSFAGASERAPHDDDGELDSIPSPRTPISATSSTSPVSAATASPGSAATASPGSPSSPWSSSPPAFSHSASPLSLLDVPSLPVYPPADVRELPEFLRSLGIFVAIVRCMQAFPDAPAPQWMGCRALSHLADKEVWCVMAANEGAIEVIARALAKHSHDAKVLRWGATAVLGLTSGSAVRSALAVNAGAQEALSHAVDMASGASDRNKPAWHEKVSLAHRWLSMHVKFLEKAASRPAFEVWAK